MNRHNATRRISLPFESLVPFLESQSTFVLLESNRDDTHNRFSYLFTDPVEILRTAVTEATAARDILARLSNLSRNRHVAGYLSYEFGYYLHERLHPLREKRPGEVWFGVFPKPVRFDHRKGVFSRTIPLAGGAAESRRTHSINAIKTGIERDTYTEAIAKIKNHIAEGDTYQVNYTTQLSFDFTGSPLSFYAALRRRQPTSYSALIRDGENWILSLSPELFFNVRNGVITARPMKGTMRRGRTTEEDRKLADALHHDEKNRAENVMIVDLMRNDIGSIAATGSVKVPELYTVEKYRTVLQMTSTVTGTLRKGISPGEIFAHLFPCGSVTGAPKLRTMEIIRQLEPEPRGVYTGAIGFLAPGGEACFNVPIRTVTLRGNRGTMGIGSGIVWDSDPEAEYKECMLKADFLTQSDRPVSLIESMRYENGLHRLDLHLGRLEDSADYFGIPVSIEEIREYIAGKTASLPRNTVYKVRLTVDGEGRPGLTTEPIPATTDEPVRVRLSGTPVDSGNRYLYHKTTERDMYTAEYERAIGDGYFDVLFYNERKEITEGAVSNVYIRQGDRLVTPPVTCGLLNGVYRRYLIGEGRAIERVVTIGDLSAADELYVSNSVRGLLRCVIDTNHSGDPLKQR
jgi:para-aminobenzoate synthetase / 4-amino-4-deoxychorismate lyase